MSEQAVIGIFGILFTVLFALVGALFRVFSKRFDVLEEKTKDSLLATHLGMDREREKHWMEWRRHVDERLHRHDERIERIGERQRQRMEGK